MKTMVKTLALLVLLGFLGSGCATVSRLNAEYEEEMTRVETMSPEEKAEWEKAHEEREKINWDEFLSGGD
jgi:outer membrane lipoprotein-sorting protein